MSPSDKFKTWWTHNSLKIFKTTIHTLLFKSHHHNDLEKSMKTLIQVQNTFNQDINRLEVQMSQLINTYRNDKTLSYQYLANPDIFNPIDLA